jgi:hypothetical protein
MKVKPVLDGKECYQIIGAEQGKPRSFKLIMRTPFRIAIGTIQKEKNFFYINFMLIVAVLWGYLVKYKY